MCVIRIAAVAGGQPSAPAKARVAAMSGSAPPKPLRMQAQKACQEAADSSVAGASVRYGQTSQSWPARWRHPAQ